MFEDRGPVAVVAAQREFIEDYGSKIDPDLKERLRAANREVSPVPALLAGVEVLYVIAREKPLSTAAGKEATLQTLGTSATAMAGGQFGGAERRDRAWALAAWAAYQISPSGAEPAAPEVDPAYTTIVPEPVEEPAPH